MDQQIETVNNILNTKANNFWKSEFSEGFDKAHIISDFGEIIDQEARINNLKVVVSYNLTSSLLSLTNNSLSKLYYILLGSGIICLKKSVNGQKTLLGIPLLIEETIEKPCTNKLLPLIYNWNDNYTCKELLNNIREKILGLSKHQDYPINLILNELGIEPDIFNLVGVVILLQNIQHSDDSINLNSKIVFDFEVCGSDLEFVIHYHENLYKKATIEILSKRYLYVLEQIITNLNQNIKDIEILPKQEKETILLGFNRNSIDFPLELTVSHYVERNAINTTDKIALKHDNNYITYQKLNERSNQLAHYLRSQGLEKNTFAIVLLDRGIWIIETILAIWKLGAAYIPVDINTPKARILEITKDSNANLIITTQKLDWNKISECNMNSIVLEQCQESICIQDNANINCQYNCDDVAYVIYTSGSTGKPKGAIVEHKGMMNHIYSKINDIKIDQNSIIVQNASHTFDISVWQFFSAFVTSGTTLIISNKNILEVNRFTNLIICNFITILEVVPSYLSVILDYLDKFPKSFKDLKKLLVTGEAIKANLVNKWLDAFPYIPVINAYGPTEASDDITHYKMQNKLDENLPVPIGKPIQNMNLYILDNNDEILPICTIGEICVAGIGVGRGYLNDPIKTQKVFCNNDIITGGNFRFYRTGDIGRWLPEGIIEFLGRKDQQIKIRGYRIELEEIENRILSYPNIKLAIVNAFDHDKDSKYLCGYIQSGNKIDHNDLKAFLMKILPDYMIPSYFVEIKEFPLNSNGKIDRKALKEPSTYIGNNNQTPQIQELIYIPSKQVEIVRLSLMQSEVEKQSITDQQYKQALESVYQNYKHTLDEVKKHNEKSHIEAYPLSKAQERIYFREQQLGSLTSIEYGYVFYKTELNAKILEQTINIIINSNDALKTKLFKIKTEQHDFILQTFSSTHLFSLKTFDFVGKEISVFQDWVKSNINVPFDVYKDDFLFDISLLKIEEEKSCIYMKIHHLIHDGWTIRLFFSQIDKVYELIQNGNQYNVQPSSYKEYIKNEAEYLYSSEAENDRKYWLAYFLTLPVEETIFLKKIEEYSRLDSETLRFSIHSILREKIIEYCESNITTPYRFILSVLATYFYIDQGLEEISIGTVYHGRTKRKYNEIMGDFINFFPLIVRIKNSICFNELQETIRDTISNNTTHQNYPYNFIKYQINELLKSNIDNLTNITVFTKNSSNSGLYEHSSNLGGNFAEPIALVLEELDFTLNNIEYRFHKELFTKNDISQFHKQFIFLCEKLLDNPDIQLSDIKLSGIEYLSSNYIHKGKINIDKIEKQLIKECNLKECKIIVNKQLRGNLLDVFVSSPQKPSTEELNTIIKNTDLGDSTSNIFYIAENIPIKENGRVDINLLRELSKKLGSNNKVLNVSDPISQKLISIFSEATKISEEQVDENTNFFESGGHSISAMMLANTISKEFGIIIPFEDIFKYPSVGKLNNYILSKRNNSYGSVKLTEKKEYYHLSSAQKRLYILQKITPKSTTFNIPMFLQIEDELDIGKLTKTFLAIIERHESLRTSIIMLNGEPMQRIHKTVDFEIPIYNINNSSKIIDELYKYIQPFDLSKAPFLRVEIFKISENKHILMYDIHHIATDGISNLIIENELRTIYSSGSLTMQKYQYKDFSEWQNTKTQNTQIQIQKQYWLDKFKGQLPKLDLPTDFPRYLVQGEKGASYEFAIDKIQLQALNILAKKESVTLNMILLSAYYVWLMKLSGQEDIIVGSPVADRKHKALQDVVGMFLNTIPFRNFPVRNKKFTDFLSEVKENQISAFKNSDYQFEDLVDNLDIERDLNRNPLFDVMFILQNYNLESTEPANNNGFDINLSSLNAKKNTAALDLTLTVIPSDEFLLFDINYSTGLFTEQTIIKYCDYFYKLISSILANPSLELGEIDMYHEKEKQDLLIRFNDTTTQFPIDKNILQLLHEQVLKNGDKKALVFQDNKLTYKELDLISNHFANNLQEQGVRINSLVALKTEPCLEMIIAILGVLKVGAVFIPLDITWTDKRINYILNDCNPDLLVTKTKYLNEELVPIKKLFLDDDGNFKVSRIITKELHGMSNLLHCIYTSGTMNLPKPVLISVENFMNYFFWFTSITNTTSEDKFLISTSFAYDGVYAQLYCSLLNGAELHLLSLKEYNSSDAFLQYTNKHNISCWNLTPSLFNILINNPNFHQSAYPSLRLILMGGEKINLNDINKYFNSSCKAKVLNQYGVTEATISSTACYIQLESLPYLKQKAIIGKPIANTKIYILDNMQQLVPIAVNGELYIGGAGVTNGFLNNIEQNNLKYIKNPFEDGIIFKTGDIAKWLPDGQLVIIDRIDNQKVIRGHRIETEEIEYQTKRIDGVSNAISVVDEKEEEVLLYYTATSMLSAEIIRTCLIGKIPTYMIPSQFIQIDKFPITIGGKMDLLSLHQQRVLTVKRTDDSLNIPVSELEVNLAKIWQEELKVDKIKMDNFFFDSGGNSLILIKVATKIQDRYKVEPDLENFYYMTFKEFVCSFQKKLK